MKPNILLSLTITGTLFGCVPELMPDNIDTGETETGNPEVEPDPNLQQPAQPGALEDLADEARDAMTQVFTVDADHFNEIQGEQGTTLYLWANSLVDSDGNLVHGSVDLELIEVYSKASMLVTDVPTNGQRSTGEIAQLVSGGEFYVNASQNGEDLDLDRAYMVLAPTDATGGPDNNMELFKLDGPDNAAPQAPQLDKPVWVEAQPNENEEVVEVFKGDADGDTGASSQYGFLTQEFGWSNIDRWYSYSGPKTTIHVDVPDGWDDENCAVYLSYDGENTLARFDTYDENTGLFSEHYGLIPIGLNVHVIFMTESEGEWSYAIQQTTIVDNHVSVFDNPDDFLETDTDGLIAAIDALP